MSGLEKTKQVAGHFLTIYAVMAILFSGIAWAADEYHQQFLKKEDFEAAMTINKNEAAKDKIAENIALLNDEIAQLRIDKKYARTNREKNRIEEKIILKETKIKNLKGE
jgi:hypothetical protein